MNVVLLVSMTYVWFVCVCMCTLALCVSGITYNVGASMYKCASNRVVQSVYPQL